MPVNENYSFERADRHLQVCLLGEQTLDVLQSLVKDIFDECMSTTCRHVLVDARGTTGMLSTVDKYELGMTAANYGSSGIRVACVDDVPERMDRFFETVAVNRGVVVKVFAEIGEAEAWLHS